MKSFECLCNVEWHGEHDCAIGVVPFEMNSKEDFAFPVDGDWVGFSEGVDEVLGIVLIGVFDTEIIDDETEYCVSCDVTEKAWCNTGSYIAMWLKML